MDDLQRLTSLLSAVKKKKSFLEILGPRKFLFSKTVSFSAFHTKGSQSVAEFLDFFFFFMRVIVILMNGVSLLGNFRQIFSSSPTGTCYHLFQTDTQISDLGVHFNS